MLKVHWPLQYNWNIVESGVKHHHNPTPPQSTLYTAFCTQNLLYDFYFDGDDDEMKYRKFINIT
jgi:hypothetical protein